MATTTTALGFQNFFSATLQGDITSSSTDILLDAIPNASQGFLVIDPDSTTNREVIFYTSKTALKVICTSAADGRGQDDTTAVSHLQGTTVISAPVAGNLEALQDGTALSDSIIKNRHLSTATGEIGAVWQSWTPTWANLTIGNAVVGAKYIQVGKTVLFRITVDLGSTTSVGTNPTFTLPVTSITVPHADMPIAWGQYNTGAGSYNAFSKWVTTTTSKLMYWDTNNNEVAVTATTPNTWSSSYFIHLQGQYEAA
jgi:hypothetical protein